MLTKSSLFVALPGTALLGLGLSHANHSPGPASPPAGETAAHAGLVFGDVDGDGLDDAFVVGAEGQARLLMNFGEGRFEDVTLAANLAELGGATCALFADLDGDGRLDLFAGSSEQRLWRNLGNATFEPMPSGIEHDLVDLAAQAVDHDQDGRLDLQIHTEAGDLVYRNLGEGRFERLALPLGELPKAPSLVGWITPESVDAAAPLAAPDSGTPAQRRLGRWIAGRTLAVPTAPSSIPLVVNPGNVCAPAVEDSASSACIGASSVPTLGKLLPLNDKFYVDPTTRHVSIGGTSPFWPLTVISNGDGFVQLNNAENIAVGSFAGGGRGWFGTYGNHPLALFVNYGQPSLLIDTSGNVGIGTTSPARKLDVSGGAAFAGTDGELVNVTQTSNLDGADGLVARHTSTTSSASVAVLGIASSAGNWGVLSEGNFAATGTKAFLQPHPTDAAKQVRFFCLEGNESGTYFRGKTRLVGRRAVIAVPEDFRLASEPSDLTVQLTPVGPARVWLESYGLDEVRVCGEADVEVHYIVQGVRRGYAGLETIEANTAFRPTEIGQPFGTQYPQTVRDLLVANGILNADYTPNEATATRLGWQLRDAEVPDVALETATSTREPVTPAASPR